MYGRATFLLRQSPTASRYLRTFSTQDPLVSANALALSKSTACWIVPWACIRPNLARILFIDKLPYFGQPQSFENLRSVFHHCIHADTVSVGCNPPTHRTWVKKGSRTWQEPSFLDFDLSTLMRTCSQGQLWYLLGEDPLWRNVQRTCQFAES